MITSNKEIIPSLKSRLSKIKHLALDMDGTIYLDDDLFDGTLDFLEYVKRIGGKYFFLTNNSSKSVDKYIEKIEIYFKTHNKTLTKV